MTYDVVGTYCEEDLVIEVSNFVDFPLNRAMQMFICHKNTYLTRVLLGDKDYYNHRLVIPESSKNGGYGYDRAYGHDKMCFITTDWGLCTGNNFTLLTQTDTLHNIQEWRILQKNLLNGRPVAVFTNTRGERLTAIGGVVQLIYELWPPHTTVTKWIKTLGIGTRIDISKDTLYEQYRQRYVYESDVTWNTFTTTNSNIVYAANTNIVYSSNTRNTGS